MWQPVLLVVVEDGPVLTVVTRGVKLNVVHLGIVVAIVVHVRLKLGMEKLTVVVVDKEKRTEGIIPRS